MHEHRKEFATVLAFDVKVTPEAAAAAEHLNVRVFAADIIYHLTDQFDAYLKEAVAKKQEAGGVAAPAGQELKKQPEGFADLASFEGPAGFASAEAPAGCYPRDQLTPSELLPLDQSSIYAQQNPMGPGSLKGKNFLSAGALIGVNTVGQSLRNANLQLRSEPPNPQVPVSVFNQTTIEPDINRRTLEIN
jgi:hypothetical protein